MFEKSRSFCGVRQIFKGPTGWAWLPSNFTMLNKNLYMVIILWQLVSKIIKSTNRRSIGLTLQKSKTLIYYFELCNTKSERAEISCHWFILELRETSKKSIMIYLKKKKKSKVFGPVWTFETPCYTATKITEDGFFHFFFFFVNVKLLTLRRVYPFHRNKRVKNCNFIEED